MSEPSHDQQLDAILHSYLQAVDAGQKPDREELLRRHPNLAEELRGFFSDQAKLDRMALSLNQAHAGDITLGTEETANASGAVPRIRYFGDYELLEEIARGGMGVVYKARQVSLHRTVAVKMILQGELATPVDVQRFQDEARAAANLNHPNIVPIYEIGSHEGQQYFSMKLIGPGQRREQLGMRETVRVMALAARAVHHAHQRGILHRDLKPSNILFDEHGEPFVADFGLAKQIGGDSGTTKTGTVVGTPSYMAPEQARADRSLTIAVDVYSLGAILYEWLTGRPPFRGLDPLATMMMVLADEPSSPRALNRAIDRDLETICLKCLDKDPQRRYSSAQALAEDLDRWQAGEPIQARPIRTWQRLVKWARRRPAAAALAVVSLLALITLLGVGLAFNYHLSHAYRAVSEQKNEADSRGRMLQTAYNEIRQQATELESRGQRLEKERNESQERLWKALFEQARAEQLTGQRWRALELLAEAARHKVTPELRQAAIETINTPGLREVCKVAPRFFPHAGHNAGTLVYSADNTMLAIWDIFPPENSKDPFATGPGSVQVYELPSGKFVNATDSADPHALAFSPSAPILAIAGPKNTLRLWDPRSGQDLFAFPGQAPLCFNGDGKLLAAAGADADKDRKVAVWDLATKQKLTWSGAGTPLRFIASGELLLGDDRQLRVCNVHTGAVLRETPKDWAPQWFAEERSSDEVLLPYAVAGDVPGDLVMLSKKMDRKEKIRDFLFWNAGTGEQAGPPLRLPVSPRDLTPQFLGGGAMPASRASGLLAVSDAQRTIRLLDLDSGDERGRLNWSDGDVNMVIGRFSPDGSLLASREYFSNGNFRIWDVYGRRDIGLLAGDGLVWSPAGKYVAVAKVPRTFQTGDKADKGIRFGTVVYEVAPPVAESAATAQHTHLLLVSPGGEQLAAGVQRHDRIGMEVWNIVRQQGRRTLSPSGEKWTVDLSKNVLKLQGPPFARVNWQEQVEKLGKTAGHSPDGRSKYENGFLFDALTGAKKHPHALKVGRILFAPNGKIGYSMTHHEDVKEARAAQIIVIDVEAWKITRRIPNPHDVTDESSRLFSPYGADLGVMALSPDGTLLATAGRDRMIRLWHAPSMRELARWTAHPDRIQGLTFFPDGKTLASDANPCSIRLWDLDMISRELKLLGLDW